MATGFDFSLLDAPVVRRFRGRTRELAQLEQHALDDQCSLISVLGMGGMGKSWLARQFLDAVGDAYDVRTWVSLLNAPSWQDTAHNILRSIEPSAALDTGAPNELLRRVHQAVSTTRCLLVLDNFESLMEPLGQRRGHFRQEHEGFDPLLRVLVLGSAGLTVLTSRERPATLDAVGAIVRTVTLPGLSTEEAAVIGRDAGVEASLDQWRAVVDRFGGNPQLVKLAAASALTLGGDLGAFLASRGDQLEGERELFEWHVSRLSPREQSTMYWLAALRSSSGMQALSDRFYPRLGPSDPSSIDILRRLRDSAVIEWSPPDQISLQPAMLEFVTARLVDQFVLEISGTRLAEDGVLASQALMIASAPAQIRSSLRQLLAEPILVGLRGALGSPKEVGRHLRRLLDRVRTRPELHSSYAAGNLCNLLVAVEGDLSHLDFSKLTIRNADLSATRLTQSRMVDAELVDTEIAQTFGNILACAASERGGWVAAAGTDNDVWLWDRSGHQQARFVGHSNWVRDLSFNDDGTLLASVSSDGALRIWDTGGADLRLTIEAHPMRIWSVAWSGHGILTASQDCTLKLWSELNGSLVGVLTGHAGPVTTVDAVPSGDVAFSGGGDGLVRSWDLSTCRAIDVRAVAADISAVRSYGQDRLIVGTRDGRIIVIEQQIGHFGTSDQLADGLSCVNSLDVDDRGALVSAHDDGGLAIWDLAQMRLVTRLGGHLSRTTSARFRGRDLLVSGGEDQTIRLWDTSRWELTDVLIGRASHAWSLALIPGKDPESLLLLTGHEDGTVHCWRSRSPQSWVPEASWRRHDNRVWCVRADQRRSLAVSASEDGFATVWDVSDGSIVSRLGDHHSAVWAADFDFSGQTVLAACDDGSLHIWDIRSGSNVKTIEAHRNRIRSLACNPVASSCVTGGEDFALKLWDTVSGELLETYDGHSDRVNAVAFDSSGQRFVSGGRDGVVALWELGRSSPVWTHHSDEYVWAVAIDPIGRRIAYGTESGRVVVIDPVAEATPTQWALHRQRIKSLVFSDDSSLLLSCSEEGNIKAIDAAAVRIEASFEAPRAYEGLDITGIRGVSEAAVATLVALGAVHRERSDEVALASAPDRGSVFVSYAREDLGYVRELVAILERSGIRVWLDQTEVQNGDSFAQKLRTALDGAAAVVVVMSVVAARSRWVRREVQYAESSNTQVFPILLDGEPFFELGDLHFEDVRGGAWPSATFIERVRAAVHEAEASQVVS